MHVTAPSIDRDVALLRFPSRRLLVAVGALALLFVLVLGLKLRSVRGPVNVDRQAAAHIITESHGRNDDDFGYRDIVDLGSGGPVALGILVMAGWALKRRDATGMIVAIAGPIAALFLAEAILKPLVERRAFSGALSYPSGHVTAGASVATAVLLILYRYAGWRWALAWSPFAALGSMALAVSVIAIGWHYATDSIAGIALGTGVVCLMAAAADSATRQLSRPA